MNLGRADLEDTVRGVRVRLRSVPAWTCPSCGQQQITLAVARYVSEYLRRLLTAPPVCPDDLDRPLVPTEVVFAA